MMFCPKHAQEPLLTGQLMDGLKSYQCPVCSGAWIKAKDYQVWQSNRGEPSLDVNSLTVPITQDVTYEASRYDSRAGLCPDCGFYLVRGRINLQKGAFFIERCPGCKGIWCDDGEWDVLDRLGLSAYISLLFTDEWQSRVRIAEAEFRERPATIEKLGGEIAE